MAQAGRAQVLLRLARAAMAEGPAVVDRVRIRSESRAVQPRAPKDALATSDDWLADLHRVLHATWPCPQCAGFQLDVWPGIGERIASNTASARHQHDADVQLAHAAWSTTLHLRPEHVVETGVARGVTSAAVLSALHANGAGRLFSIDLPPLTGPWAEQSGAAVAPELRGRWTYVRGATLRRLPQVLDQLPAIDLFIHDSLHTYRTMTFEFTRAWAALREGGVVLSDDIDDSRAFHDFVARQPPGTVVVGAEEAKDGGRFGLVRKPAGAVGGRCSTPV
jgi:predicted O-methyltransferase YrrM